MKRVNDILIHRTYKKYINKIILLEKSRIYCKHDMAHFIDVARISYILSLENNLNVNKELIYAAALLHDIGRWREYEEGVDHARASKDLAVEILNECNFIQEEITLICEAIGHHRIKEDHTSHLSKILYKADKLSRPCTSCRSIDSCKRYLHKEKPILSY